MKRTIALTLTALLAFVLGGASPGNAVNDDHGTALAAIADVEAARAEIVHVENSQIVGHPAYLHEAQRALNAIVGRSDELYVDADGDPGDGNGAIGNVDHLLDRRDDQLWTPAMQGAKANLLAVVVDLHDAMHEKEMENYETDLTQALANLALVNGRPSEDGVLGGLTGALANTSLGVPAGAAMISGCTLPSHGPAYGVVNGHLAYVALPRKSPGLVPPEMSVSRVVVNGDAVVLYTRQTDQVAALCRQAHLQRTRAVRRVSSASAPQLVADVVKPDGPASYTPEQARAGLAVFQENCQSCHGANLQGIAGPAVAGNAFLETAKSDKWTLADFRNLIVQNMPLNNPGTLTPDQYAKVIAFLLAANCYPPGTHEFPQKDDPSFVKVNIGPVDGATPTDPKLGVCALK